jgi:biotin operon repressor
MKAYSRTLLVAYDQAHDVLQDLLREDLGMADKEYKEFIAELRTQGWTVEPTSQGHWCAKPPDKALTIVHFSETADVHGRLNVLRDLRKRGFEWPPPSKNEEAGAARMKEEAHKDSAATLQSQLLREQAVTQSPPPKTKLPTRSYATVVPETAQPFGPQEPTTKTEDQLFSELKEARSYHALADEHLKECQRKLEEATRELTSATNEKRKAAEDLAKKKAAFDKVFEAT